MSTNTKIMAGIVVVAAIAGIVSVSRSRGPAPASKAPIKIAAVLGLTGYAAEDSLGVKRGIDLAVADLAAKGIAVHVDYQDDKTDPKQTVSAVQYLISTDKPAAIIGPIWSYLEDAAVPLLTQDKIVNYAPANTSEFTTGGPYDFHGAVKNQLIVPSAAQWLQAKNAKKVAIIISKDAWGDSVDKAFQAAVARAGGQVVLDDAILTDDNSASAMSADLAKAKSLGAEAIMFTGYDEEDVALVERRKELGFTAPVLAHTREYQELLSAKTVSPDELAGVDYLSVEVAPGFVAEYEKAYGQEPGNYSDRAYDGVMLLVQAIQNVPQADGDALVAYIRAHPYQGYAGLYQFDEKGDLKGGNWVIYPVIKRSP